MNKRYSKIYNLILLFTLVSCTYFLPKVDSIGPEVKKTKVESKPNYCQKDTKFELISTSKEIQDIFVKSLAKIRKAEVTLSIADRVILWSFLQMNSRPELTTPYSQTNIVIHNKAEDFYIQVSSNEVGAEKGATPYIHALELIRKKLKGKRSLKSLNSIYQKYFPNFIPIETTLSKFLSQNQKKILSSPALSKYYARGDEIIKSGESISKAPISKFLRPQIYRDEKLYNQDEHLYEYQQEDAVKIKCNYDMKLYSSSIYLINDNFINANFFGIKELDLVVFISTSLKKNKIEPIEKTIFFKGESKAQPPAICYIQNSSQTKSWLFSSKSRDPGQHLFHFMKYGMEDISNIEQLSKFLNFSRHLLLRQPLRLVFESKKGSQEQLDNLLKLNIPIYNAEILGNVWGFLSNPSSLHFIYDQRNIGNNTCI